MPVPRLPRIKLPGLSKINAALEQWAYWIEYAVAVRGQWPIEVNRTPTGNLVKIDGQSFLPRIMCVTTTIPAATGTGPLTISQAGRARETEYDPSTNQEIDDTTAVIEVVLNFHNKSFVAGAFIKAQHIKGREGLYAFDINDCAKFT